MNFKLKTEQKVGKPMRYLMTEGITYTQIGTYAELLIKLLRIDFDLEQIN